MTNQTPWRRCCHTGQEESAPSLLSSYAHSGYCLCPSLERNKKERKEPPRDATNGTSQPGWMCRRLQDGAPRSHRRRKDRVRETQRDGQIRRERQRDPRRGGGHPHWPFARATAASCSTCTTWPATTALAASPVPSPTARSSRSARLEGEPTITSGVRPAATGSPVLLADNKAELAESAVDREGFPGPLRHLGENQPRPRKALHAAGEGVAGPTRRDACRRGAGTFAPRGDAHGRGATGGKGHRVKTTGRSRTRASEPSPHAGWARARVLYPTRMVQVFSGDSIGT